MQKFTFSLIGQEHVEPLSELVWFFHIIPTSSHNWHYVPLAEVCICNSLLPVPIFNKFAPNIHHSHYASGPVVGHSMPSPALALTTRKAGGHKYNLHIVSSIVDLYFFICSTSSIFLLDLLASTTGPTPYRQAGGK